MGVLAICIFMSGCSENIDLAEQNKLQQTEACSTTSAPQKETEANVEGEIRQILERASAEAEDDRYYIVEAVDNKEAYERDSAAKFFIKKHYPDYFSNKELLRNSIAYGHYEEMVYSEHAGENNGYGKYYQMGKILNETAQKVYKGTVSVSDAFVIDQMNELEELLQFFYGDYYGSKS